MLYTPGNDIRIFGCVVLLIAAVDVDLPSLQQVDLSPLTVILPLTRELALLKPEDNNNIQGLGRQMVMGMVDISGVPRGDAQDARASPPPPSSA